MMNNLIQAIDHGQFAIQCPSLKAVTYLCISRNCTASANYCDDNSCTCLKAHQFCESIRISSLGKLLSKVHEHEKRFLCSLLQVEQKAYEVLRQRRNQITAKISFQWLEEKQRQIIAAIYSNTGDTRLEGNSIKDLFVKLKYAASRSQNQENELLKAFSRNVSENNQQLLQSQIQIINRFFQSRKIKIQIGQSQLCAELFEMKQKFILLQQQSSKIQMENRSLAQQIGILRKQNKFLQEQYSKATHLNGDLTIKALISVKELEELKNSSQPLRKAQSDLRRLQREKQYIEGQCSVLRSQKYKAMISKAEMQEQTLMLQQQLEATRNKVALLLQQLKGSEDQLKLQLVEDYHYLSEGFIGSKILAKDNAEDASFICESLKKPKRLILLFRASEHDFSSKSFHKFCDGIEHTFTLVQTEFGKILAGYTPVMWQSGQSQSEGKFLADQSMRSFIMSVSLKKVMPLIDQSNALWCRQDWAACFGGDLSIVDKCNVRQQSYVLHGYRYHTDKIQANEMIGSDNNSKYFKVSEYEVYKVIW